MLGALSRYFRRRKYRVGAQLSEFLAPDIRRDVEVVDASEVDAGYVTARVRTWNVLHARAGQAGAPALPEPRRIAISELWRWTGEPWGGAVPDDSR